MTSTTTTTRSSFTSKPPSLYTTRSNSTISTEKSLLSPSKSKSKTKTKKSLWYKTKSVLASIGEPPTASYDRKQAALGRTTTYYRRGVDYGVYREGGPWAGSKI